MSSWYVNVVSGVPLIRLEGWPLFIGFECEIFNKIIPLSGRCFPSNIDTYLHSYQEMI